MTPEREAILRKWDCMDGCRAEIDEIWAEADKVREAARVLRRALEIQPDNNCKSIENECYSECVGLAVEQQKEALEQTKWIVAGALERPEE